ncbi:MAG: hypothetical protein U1F83_05075 [Verrucomicrobiota bacterium]
MRKVFLLSLLALAHTVGAQSNLSGHAAELFKKAQAGKFYATAAKLQPDYLPTSDGQSFLCVWRTTGTNTPRHWIVSLTGHEGLATDDLAIWSPHLQGRDVGFVSVQWWIGNDNEPHSYYTPEQVHREIDRVLQKLGATPGTVMLHGFSRGSANAYAVAALDQGRGKKYFALNVASSGRMVADYRPNRTIMNGGYGDHPLRGTHWVTSAGAKDTEQSTIEAMRRTAAWLKEQGATVDLAIEDPNLGHGALMLNPNNIRQVLDLFFAEKK